MGLRMRGAAPLQAVAALLLLLTPLASGRLMAVDFGSENIRVSLVNSNRRPIQVEVVNNEISKRKTAAVVGHVNGERLLGEAAASVASRFPQTVIARARDMLGKSAADEDLQAMLGSSYLPYELSDDEATGSIRISVGPDESYTAEELVASVLHYAHKISEAQFGGTFQDCVIVIPPFMGMRQRQAILDAAHIAGLNVISLIHSHSGAALQYGIERDFNNNTETVIFYDMGASSVEVSLAKFSSVNKARKFQQFEVLDVAWDESLGGTNLDLLLMEHFAGEFEEKHKKDIRKHPKVMAKLRKAVKKTKEILSANKAAPIHSEELHDGIDFSSSVTREKFEELAADFFEHAAKPLLTILERNGLKPAEVSSIELIGGGVRVPKLQEALTAALDGQPLSRHFTDPDEAVVLGSGLFAANFSNSFRLRPFGMVDCSPYALTLDVATEAAEAADKDAAAADKDAAPAEADEDKDEDTAEGGKNKQMYLLPFRKKLPIKRTVKLGRVAGDTANLTLSYNASEVLPPGTKDTTLGTYTISGMAESLKKYNKTGKVSVHFAVGPSGMVTIEKAESVFEIVEYVEVEVPVKEDKKNETDQKAEEDVAEGDSAGEDKQATDDADADEEKQAEADASKDADAEAGDGEAAPEDATGEDAAKADGADEAEAEAEAGSDETDTKESKKKVKKKAAAKEKPKMEKVMKQKKRTIRMPLKVSGGLNFGLSAEQLAESRAKLADIAKKDEEKRATEAAKNDLESFIIDIGSLLYEDDIIEVSTEESREKISAEATTLEDWLYEEGENEVAATYRAKLAGLKELIDPIQHRAKELEARPAAVDTVTTTLEEMTKDVETWEEERPWINATDRDALLDSFSQLVKWVGQRTTEQESKKPYEDAAFTSDELLAKLAEVTQPFRKLLAKKPPPAPKAPKTNTTDANSTNTTETISPEGEEGEDEGEGADAQDEQQEQEDANTHDELR